MTAGKLSADIGRVIANRCVSQAQYWNGVGELQSRQEFDWVSLRKDYDPDGGWIDARPGDKGLPPSGTITLHM